MSKKRQLISKVVILLGLVSFFTDLASEMLYPVIPLYLESIGFTALGIGFLEGIAQGVAGLSKGYFGRWSDINARRMPFIRVGYSISAIAKPLMALIPNPYWVLLTRTADRLGKGIRTGARDALLSDVSNAENKARVFGLHRAMDTLGATVGPIVAILILLQFPGNYKLLFLLAIIPGVFAIFSTFLIKEKKTSPSEKKPRPTLRSSLDYLKNSSYSYRKLIIGLIGFTLLNSSDLFLLLYLSTIGLEDQAIIWIYVFYNLIFALASYPVGIMADKIGMKFVFVLGIFIFAVVYLGLSFFTSFSTIIVFLFVIYGLFAACTDGVSKAWISNIVNGKEVGSAIGFYESFNSIAAMLSSAIGGLVWFAFGYKVFFISTGLLALILLIFFIYFVNEKDSFALKNEVH